MRGLALLVSVSGCIVVAGIAYLVLKRTVLDVRFAQRNPWGLLWYLSIASVLIPLILVSYLGIDKIKVFYIAYPGLELPVTEITLVTLGTYILSLGIFLRLFGLSYRRWVMDSPLNSKWLYKKLTNICFALSLFNIFMLGIFYFFGYKHAFLTSVIEGTPLLKVRLMNKYSSQVPSQVASLVFTAGYLLAIFSGYVGRYSIARSVVYLTIALLTLTAPGNKAPLVIGILLWIFAQGALLPRYLFSLKLFIGLMLIIFIGLGLAYLGYYLQAPQSSFGDFEVYLVNRLGVGQMAGMYETLALATQGYLSESNFYWHMIPFASFFVDYIDYQKYLMMISEGYEFAEMGVKNTYFVAEAYAMGGIWLAALSPVIVAFASSLSLYCLMKMFKSAVGSELAIVAVPIYFLTHDITGGFSSFPLLKGLLLLTLHLGVLWGWWRFVSFIRFGLVKKLPRVLPRTTMNKPCISNQK